MALGFKQNLAQDNANKVDVAVKDSDSQNLQSLKTWYADTYESAITQRNFFIIVTIASIVAIIASMLVIRYMRSTKSIEPFVIEIERKTGVPTVVDPVSRKDYTANQSIKRYFIMQYIKAREEYFYQTFQRNYDTVVKVFSAPNIYYSDYRPKYSPSNSDSPYNLYGQNAIRVVNWKSIIFQTPQLAQVRLSIEVQGSLYSKIDKLVLIGFEFQDSTLTEAERLINPLGFVVTMYKIEDENVVSDR